MHARPLFILGFPRSGTTLLRLMLNAHPDIAIPHEALYLEHLVRHFGDRRCTRSDMPELEAVLRPYNCWSLDMDRLVRAVEKRLPAHASELSEAIYLEWADQIGRRPQFWGCKEPWRMQHFERLADWYPKAIFLHIYRDPRDCIVSRIEHFPEQIPLRHVIPAEVTLACHWEYLVRHCRRFGHRLPPSRYHEIEYEELVRDPEARLQEVVDVLGLQYDACMLQYASSTGDPRVFATSDRRGGAHRYVTMPPTTARIARHAGHLRGWRLAVVESICMSNMRELGYVPSTRGMPGLVTAAAFLVRAVFNVLYSVWRTIRRFQTGL